MALPRPVLLAILGVAFILAALLATRAVGGDDGSASVTATPVATPRPAPERPGGNPARSEKPAAPSDRSSAPIARPPSGRRADGDSRRPARPSAARAEPGASAGLPVSLATALADGKVVVLVFSRTRAADDTATRRSVEALERSTRRGGRVVIVRDQIASIGNYRLLVSGLGVSQTPSIVILRADHQPRLLEGFIDEGSLRQHVADALR